MLQTITQITQSQYLDINKLLNGCRQSEYSDIRYIIIKYLVDEHYKSYASIGRVMNLNKSSVMRMYNSNRVSDKEYRKVLHSSCLK